MTCSLKLNHVLERLSFGITSSQIQQVNQEGLESYIQAQLNPQQIIEPKILANYSASLDLIAQEPMILQKQVMAYRKQIRSDKLSLKQQREKRQAVNKLINKAGNQAVKAHLAHAAYSHRQLQEVMVDFWFNHFNVDLNKRPIKLWVNDYTNQIRTHALGNFRDLLEVTAKHPAMLSYLDNRKNTAPDSPTGRRKKIGLNENYARELMELHTLGIDGGYTQDDIITLARILTGWGVDNTGTKGSGKGFFFHHNRHDQKDKLFLGQRIAGAGIEEGEQALDILASHPATAHFISYKLAQYFVADVPPNSLVDKLAKEFIASQGDIKVVLDALIHSQEFNDSRYYKQKLKTPYQYLISLVRMSEIRQPNFQRLRGMLRQLSMPVYECAVPTGYKNTATAWLNPQAMLQRTSFATAVSNGVLNRKHQVRQQLLQRNLGELSPHTQRVVSTSPPRLRAALILGSPEAMYR
ncbi:MAG: DUF1800 domain-containing protein [Cyanobacteria bacterium J06558_2]